MRDKMAAILYGIPAAYFALNADADIFAKLAILVVTYIITAFTGVMVSILLAITDTSSKQKRKFKSEQERNKLENAIQVTLIIIGFICIISFILGGGKFFGVVIYAMLAGVFDFKFLRSAEFADSKARILDAE